MNIFEENIRSATNAAKNPNSIVNNTGVVAGVASNTATSLPGTTIVTQIPGGVPNTTVTNPASSSQPQTEKTEKPPFPNVLSQFTSYNYAFSLSVLSRDQINTSSYKRGDLGPLILRSASGAPDKDLVETAYGKYDFYIDNLKLDGIIGYDKHSGNTNATGITFNVFEPYSMGLFFQAVQTAAFQAKYKNYMDIPMLLTIEFKGHIMDNDRQEMFVNLPDTKKFIPIKIKTMNMKVTGKGCTYDISAYPWNEQAFSTQFNVAKSDISIRCDTGKYTVQNILQTGEQSLQKVINDYFKERKEKKETEVLNEIAIIFPKDIIASADSVKKIPDEKNERSATSTPSTTSESDIGKSLGLVRGTGKNTTLVQETGSETVNEVGATLLGFNELSKADTPYPKDNAVYDSKKGTYVRGNITIDVKNSDFKFNQASSIVDMINQVILMSDYARTALNEAKKTSTGMIKWWRVESQLYILPGDESNQSGQTPKLAVFRVVPYEVDSQYLLPVNTKRPGLEQLKRESLKEYNYIYTGKNTEVLDWNIEFKAGFYTALSATQKNPETRELGSAISPGANSKSNDDLIRNAISTNPLGAPPGTQATPQAVRNERTSTSSSGQGGSGVDDEKTTAARQFQDILNAATDQFNLSLTILGDPYYLTSSGTGNYVAAPSPFKNMNSDGSMNGQNGQVHVTVNFRTPIDINLEKGMYNFGDTRPVLQFSGLYLLTKISNEFTRGKYKTTLSGLRVKGQDNPNAPEKEFTLNAESTSDTIGSAPTNTSSYWGETRPNNINKDSPNVSLPGIIRSGGFTI
jgi:hypothetical protein